MFYIDMALESESCIFNRSYAVDGVDSISPSSRELQLSQTFKNGYPNRRFWLKILHNLPCEVSGDRGWQNPLECCEPHLVVTA